MAKVLRDGLQTKSNRGSLNYTIKLGFRSGERNYSLRLRGGLDDVASMQDHEAGRAATCLNTAGIVSVYSDSYTLDHILAHEALDRTRCAEEIACGTLEYLQMACGWISHAFRTLFGLSLIHI